MQIKFCFHNAITDFMKMTQRMYSFLDNQSQTSGYSSFARALPLVKKLLFNPWVPVGQKGLIKTKIILAKWN